MIKIPTYRVPIFVSSTKLDLYDYRQKAHETLLGLKTEPIGMEYFGAKSCKPLEYCMSQIADCKIFICIVAMCYGSIDTESGLSITHLEYMHAQKLGIPTYVYLFDEDKGAMPSKFVDKNHSAKKLLDFKAELREKHLYDVFSNPDDLGRKIAIDLNKPLSRIRMKEMAMELRKRKRKSDILTLLNDIITSKEVYDE